jgi:outer membrane protein TolC
LEQRIFAGSSRTIGANAADALQSAAHHDLQAVQNELVFAAAEAYYRILQARDLVAVSTEAVAQVEQHLKIVNARYAAETAIRSDVLSVEVRLAEVIEAKSTAENRLRLAWAVLHNVTGAEIPPGPLPTEIPAAPWSARTASLQQVIEQALSQRPEIAAMAVRGIAAEEEIYAAQAHARPSLDLLADYDIFTGDLDQANDSYFVGLIMQWKVFDAGRTAHEVRRAVGRLRELQAKERRLLLDIELDVQRSYLRLKDAQQRVQVTGHALKQAEQNLHEIESRYQNAMATTTELIDAQVSLSEARARLATAQADVEISAAMLERAVGYLSDTLGFFSANS